MSETTQRDGSWIRLGAFAAFVVVVAGIYAYVMRESYQPTPDPAFSLLFVDDFNRPNNDSSLGSTGGRPWISVAGLWGIDAGKALVMFPAPEATIAVIGNVERPSIAATLAGAGRCGVVARYVDEENYLTLENVPEFGVWNVVSVVDGESTVLGRLDGSVAANVRVQLDTGDRVVTATVGDRSITVIDPVEVGGSAVGLVGYGRSSLSCAWDDVWVSEGR